MSHTKYLVHTRGNSINRRSTTNLVIKLWCKLFASSNDLFTLLAIWVPCIFRLCARLLPMFEKASIPVIRLGLNPTEELSAGGAAAGAYHPALGELVKSRMIRSETEKRLAGIVPGSRVCLFVHPKKLSQMAGQHKCNITYLQEKFALSDLAVCPDPALSEQEIRIKTDRQ